MALYKNNEIDLTQNDDPSRPKFFSLKGNGNFKYVRFLYDSMDDILWAVVHGGITINDKYRNVNCTKVANQPGSCPFCDSGMKTSKKAYIEMMVYNQESGKPNGQKEYCIWERGVNFIKELQSNVNRYVTYGTKLRDYVWEVERQDGAKPKDTVYRLRKADENVINFCPLTNDDIPAKPYDPIESGLVVSKSINDMKTFIEVGEFPSNQPMNKPANSYNQTNVASQPYQQQYYQQPQQTYQQPNYNYQQSYQPYVNPQQATNTPYTGQSAYVTNQSQPNNADGYNANGIVDNTNNSNNQDVPWDKGPFDVQPRRR